MTERESGVWSRNTPLSRAFTAPVRAMNRFLGAVDGRPGAGGQVAGVGSAVVDCGVYIDGKPPAR